MAEIREEYPVLGQEVNGHQLTYLDNAATTQTPRVVYETFEEYYAGYNANVHRGVHSLSHRASIAYEAAHDRLDIPGSVRASFYVYNTEAEVDRLLDGQFDEMRRDCVVGPEDVIREAALEYLEGAERSVSTT